MVFIVLLYLFAHTQYNPYIFFVKSIVCILLGIYCYMTKPNVPTLGTFPTNMLGPIMGKRGLGTG